MIVAAQDARITPPHVAGSSPAFPAELWGRSIRELHDLYWASYSVQVIRRGGEAPIRSGPALYLLVEDDGLVQFSLLPILKQLHWASPDAIRIRVSESTQASYRELVRASDDNRLIAIDRVYGTRTARTGRAWITGRQNIAQDWQNSSKLQDGRTQMRSILRDAETLPCSVPGVAGIDHDELARGRWLDAVMSSWTRPRAVFGSVYEPDRGVVVHETAWVPGSCRIVGPVWIGAGVQVPEGSLIIGPRVLGDAEPPKESSSLPIAEQVDWEEVKRRDYELPALTRVSSMRAIVKRAFDIVFSLCVLLATFPIYPIVMLLIYLEDGRPFFFAHTRQTRGGKNFPCIKFRTMVNDAEKIKADLRAKNMADGPQFFMKNDPRLLRIGKVLRKFQIDEFPQFINVLVGHMSVVGPRPSPDKENQYCPAWREARLSVRPGVTGLWQVRRTRAPDTDFQEWIQYDLEYVQHQSFWRDMRIILETSKQVFGG